MLVLFLCCLCRYIHILAGLTPLPDGVFHRDDVCADASLSLSCVSGQSMIVQEVQFGTKPRGVCSLSNRTSECCRYDAADCFLPSDGNVVAESCSGKTLCFAGEIAATDSGSCGFPQYPLLSHYLTTVTKCVPDTRIGQSISASLAYTGQLLYLQNTDYPGKVRSAEVSSSCSVETRSCSSKVNVYFIHFELADGRGQCSDTQQIRIEDRDVTRTYTCSNNTNFVITLAFTSSSNYLNIEFKNPDGVYDGYFWVAFEETETTAVLTLDCPAVPQTICLYPVPVTAVDFSRPTGNDVTVTENIPVEIQCTTSPERPRSTIHWYISGNSVSLGTGTNTPTNNDTLTRTTSKFSVSFNRTSSGHELFCTAFNVDGQTPIESSRKNLVVEWGPEVDVLPDQIIIENQPLSMQCTANGNPQPTNFTWTRSQDNFQQKQSILQIKNTRREDTDIYTCTAKNNMLPTGGVQTPGVGTKRMNVEILYHPDIIVSPLNGTTLIETATNVILLCTAKGEPAEYQFSKWVQYAPDGITKVKEYDSSRIEGGTSYLTFTSVSYMDSGIYYCSVRNGIEDYRTGNVIATNNTVQSVKGKPIVTGGEHDVAAAKHENSSLRVDFYSNDKSDPSANWYKIYNGEKHSLNNQDGKLLVETGTVLVNVKYYTVSLLQQGNRTQLLVQNISESDFGEYVVEIHNSIGYTSWRFTIVAEGNPDTPSLFRAFIERTSETSISLSWRSGFHGGANQTFYIQYKTSTMAWQNRAQIYGGLSSDIDFNVTINNLKSATSYSFRIFAANVYGQSDFSVLHASTIKSEVTDTSAKDSNTGAVVGGTIGGVLAITVIVVIGIIMLRRSTDFPGLKRHFNRFFVRRDDSNENTHVQETMTSSEASMRLQPQTNRSGSMHYECLVPNREPSAPYETMNTTTNNAALSDINIPRSGDKPYVALDSSLDPTHTYTSLQAAPEATSSDIVVYSNLKLTVE